MAEAVRKSRLMFLKLMAKLFASVLTLFGVLSSCENSREIIAPYGVQGVTIYGKTYSSGDSSSIAGIQIKLSNPDSAVEYAETTSDDSGFYALEIHTYEITLPDSILLTATDIDGVENGSFASKDPLLYVEEDEYYDIDLYLQEDDE